MADNLQILGKTYTNVAGIKAIDTNGNTVTFVKGESGGGSDSTNFASGTYTPSENQKVFTIDTGIVFTRFVMFATTNVYQAGSGVRTISAILYDSNMEYTWKVGSNSAGTAGSDCVSGSRCAPQPDSSIADKAHAHHVCRFILITPSYVSCLTVPAKTGSPY